MNWRILLGLGASVAVASSAVACRFCNVGPDADRYGVSDPMNAFVPDALIDQYRQDVPPAVPQPSETITSRAALAQAAAAATPQPGSPIAPNSPSSYRARLLPVSNPAPAGPAAAPTIEVRPLSAWTSHLLDGALLGGLGGVVLFFRRRAGRATT